MASLSEVLIHPTIAHTLAQWLTAYDYTCLYYATPILLRKRAPTPRTRAMRTMMHYAEREMPDAGILSAGLPAFHLRLCGFL